MKTNGVWGRRINTAGHKLFRKDQQGRKCQVVEINQSNSIMCKVRLRNNEAKGDLGISAEEVKSLQLEIKG